jgi:hypothetical protein
MNQEQTCGKGLAERSALPTKLAELSAAMAEILALHQRSLDLTDANARKELHAYVRVDEEFRIVSSLLKLTAATMAGYRDLPMARHDVRMLASAENSETFARFLKVEQEVWELLRGAIERDQKMLGQMRDAART